ncbi:MULTISPECIES: AI-2E family transporter YdiK [Enterobacterales]|jgi:predicted PurR-regulated permease PerM|uniref:Predicted PurR-regulated permease PerM n=1 Tax=Candidatus Pantoea symbiotica TaxID=1884370 RepID=A0A1I3QPC8_9GAMM|nr:MULTISPECIES: AI-2E family transporter YdiK [Enterobacterales]MDY0925592.1 AI-2E family transporter YdiK [Enterobacter sp. CFBP8995]MRT26369.1 AI-2E family transporter YdiK [Enterobacteriaceae bacterium RIT697]KAJ9433308.1 AI-2E family transporter YdiK [Pantoea sp. YR343]MBB3304777.1 putative PurR-regulated permease PerM [Enterobacter sp. Sphag1F]NYI13593.1 putative PurR-regulated permease PerM [Enterobacter sp. Sphag71]
MKDLQRGMDLPQMLFSLMFILIMIIASLWVVQPFILGFAWASMVVIATWPLMIRLQQMLWGRRSLAVIAMTILLLLLFIIPIALLVSSLIDNSAPVIAWATQRHLVMPDFDWLRQIPYVGRKLYSSYHKLVDGGGAAMLNQVQPYIGRTTGFFVAQAGHFGRFMMHLIVMLLFSVLLYWRGEQVGHGIRHFAYRMSGRRGDAAVLLAGQAIRAVALGVVVTALVQGVLGGIGLAISGIPYATLLTVLMILTCLVQLGPLVVLVPAIIWLYWSGDTTWGTVLLVWSCVVGTLDSVLRPMLIRMGADLPMILILSGVIGGLIAFGMIGLFIGPVVLAVSYRLVSVWMHEAPEPDDDMQTAIEALADHEEEQR